VESWLVSCFLSVLCGPFADYSLSFIPSNIANGPERGEMATETVVAANLNRATQVTMKFSD
jgi:hypothetical protein